jgi:hypothetical protein
MKERRMVRFWRFLVVALEVSGRCRFYPSILMSTNFTFQVYRKRAVIFMGLKSPLKPEPCATHGTATLALFVCQQIRWRIRAT